DAERVSTTGDPSRLVPSPALPRRLPHPLSIDQVEALIEAAGRPGTGRDSTARALRDRALLEVLYGLGARISEATGLDVDDIATQERAAVLRARATSTASSPSAASPSRRWTPISPGADRRSRPGAGAPRPCSSARAGPG